MRRVGDEADIVGPLSGGPAPAHVRGFGGVVNVRANGSDNHMALFVSPWAVARFLRERRYDVVHLHEPMVPLLSYYALWLSTNAARVATFHMYAEIERLPSRMARAALARVLYPAVHAAIAVSPAAADYAATSWKRPLHVIPNGVPTDVFTPSLQPGGPGDGPLRLLFVGNWRDPRKGLPVLLEAHRRMLANGTRVTLDVIGAGESGRAQADLPGVAFLGPISSESVLAEHYRRCDVFVAPATGQESFGIVLLEAMACGRPVVCSEIRGYRDVIDPEGAELVPVGDSVRLARVLDELARAPERRLTMGARNRARAEGYDWARIATRVREVYLESLTRS
jgi:phosphatidylinositol alpha-mannosyltransferase